MYYQIINNIIIHNLGYEFKPWNYSSVNEYLVILKVFVIYQNQILINKSDPRKNRILNILFFFLTKQKKLTMQ